MRISSSNLWAIVDVETNGFTPGVNRVIAVSVRTLDENLQEDGSFYSLVNPMVEPGPVHIHGITSSMLRSAPHFEEVLEKINSLTRGRILVAHNAAFDQAFLKEEAKIAGGVLECKSVLCTMKLARRVKPDIRDAKLATLASVYGVEQINAHNAHDDTRVLLELFKRMHAEVLERNLPLYSLEGGGRTSKKSVPSTHPNPGMWDGEGPLKQGMVVVFTGGDEEVRARLEEDSVERGLGLASSVTKSTSLLVTDGYEGLKARKARELGLATVSFEEYQGLLFRVEKA